MSEQNILKVKEFIDKHIIVQATKIPRSYKREAEDGFGVFIGTQLIRGSVSKQSMENFRNQLAGNLMVLYTELLNG